MIDMHPAYTPTLFQRAVMIATALTSALIGVMALSDPANFLEVMQLQAAGPAGLNEARAQYGGFFMALAIFLGAGAAGFVQTRAALWSMLVLYAGIFTGRIIHLTLFGGAADWADYNTTMQVAHVFDGTGLLLTLLALRQR